MMDAPRATLKSGLVIVNFSSPHPFLFDDDTILGSCDQERSLALALKVAEKHVYRTTIRRARIEDVIMGYAMTDAVLDELFALDQDETVDIILVARPVQDAFKDNTAQRLVEPWSTNKIRGVRKASPRGVEPIVNYADRFCV